MLSPFPRLTKSGVVLAISVFLISGISAFAETILATVSPPVAVVTPTKKQIGKVAFTFDCSQWGDKGLDHILEVMDQKKVTGTFFVTGKFVDVNKEGILKIVNAGHEVANHSWEHDRSNSIKECERVAKIYKDTTGKEMSRFFRAPFLYEDHIKWPYYAKNGWDEGYVSLITCDSLPEFKHISDRIFLNNFRIYIQIGSHERIAIHKTPRQKGPGHVNGASILMHIDGYRFHLLEDMVDIVQRFGYQCSTFSEASAARKAADWFLDPKLSQTPAVKLTKGTKKPAPPAHIQFADAKPDLEKMETARKALFDYTAPGDVKPSGEFSFTFNCHDYYREGLGNILLTLQEKHVAATFYISERYLQQVPGAVKEILEHGHEIAYYAIDADGTKTLSDAQKFAPLYKESTGQEIVRLYRPPHQEDDAKAVQNNFEITNWSNGYQSLDTTDADIKEPEVNDGRFLAYFKIYLSIAPKHQVSIMKVPYSGTGNIDGGVVALHPNGVRYPLLGKMIKSVRQKGYTIVPQSKLKTKRL